MRFDTLYFLIFFALVFALSRPVALRPYVLLGSSILFYALAGWRDVILMTSLLLVNFLASFGVRDRKWVLPLIVSVNIGALLFYKYRAFLAGDFYPQDIFGSEIIIPVGISFYVFQMTAYQVDMARGLQQPIASLPKFALFKLFFPQLIAGPIVRIREMGGQIERLFRGKVRKLWLPAFGLSLCLVGLIKKIVFADSIAPQVDWIFSAGPADTLTAWTGASLFAFQIYFDFSGYSDIAIGLAYLLGFRIPVNFRQPYLSTSPREFWQRWHITLSTWIRDYIYIPLGGSRNGGKVRQAGVLLLVMGVMGLWHGANWTFLIWGLGWGLFILFWRVTGAEEKISPPIGWLITLAVALLLWVFFRAASLEEALSYLSVMFGAPGRGTGSSVGAPVITLLGIVLFCFILQFAEKKISAKSTIIALRRWNTPLVWGTLAGLCLWLVLLPKALDNPFIYFRF